MNTRKDKNIQLSLGGFLRSHRMGEELSQTDFADFLGISKQRLSDLENDKGNVSIKLCKELADKIGVPAEWLASLALQDMINKAGLNLKIAVN
jgi:transcriptional regulator with XRE-family HTH domain